MNAIYPPFATYTVRDEQIRVALNKAVREDESHSALADAGFQAILAALVVSPGPAVIEKSKHQVVNDICVTSFQRGPQSCNALQLPETSKHASSDQPQLEPSCGLSGCDDERTTAQSLPSAQIHSPISSVPITTDGPAIAPADTVAECIITMRQSGQTECRIHVDAPNFGLIDIRLIVNGPIVKARLTLADEKLMKSMAELLPSILARLEQAGVNFGGMELAHRQTPGDPPADSALGDAEFPQKDRGPDMPVPFIIRGRLDVTV